MEARNDAKHAEKPARRRLGPQQGHSKHFNNANEGHGIAKPDSAFKWLLERLQVDGRYADHARTGRPPRIMEEQLRHCMHYFKKEVAQSAQSGLGSQH